MYPVADVGQLIAAPLERFLVCSSCVVWVQREDRIGVIHSAPKLDPADFPILARCISVATHPSLAAKYDVVLDMSCVVGMDFAGFEFITRWLQSSYSLFEPRVRRVVGMAPDGVAGAALRGLLYAWGSRFDARIFGTRDELYEALEIDAADAGDLQAIYNTYGPGPLRQFRDVAASHVNASSAQLATRVGVTERSLRRLLAHHGTTLRAELALARVRVATSSLAATQTPLRLIAKSLGYVSMDAFHAEFEAATGRSPSEYRAGACARSASPVQAEWAKSSR